MRLALPVALLAISIQLAVSVAPAGGANTMILENAFYPSWSPDGTELVCCRAEGDGQHTEDFRIWRVSATGENPTLIIDDPQGAALPLWLPDGDHIVYRRPGEFVVADLLGSPSAVWPVDWVWDDHGVCLTPSGDELLYTDYSGSNAEIRALDLSTGTTRFVWQGAGGAISPDGQWIAFVTADDSVSIAQLGGGEVRTFEFGAWPRWTPDGQSIIFTGLGASGSADLILIGVDGSGRTELTGGPLWDYNAAVSPDGSQAAYYRNLGSEFPPFDTWIVDLEVAPVEQTTWGAVKSRYR
jgi:Tol biopolymer transport system component